jgi:UDP-3-O-[3-hydroxymyristoyl] glucosamine N-acyltransferase
VKEEKQIPIIEIVNAVNGELKGDDTIVITGVASLKEAKEGYISFLGNKKYASQVKETSASAIFVNKEFNIHDAAGKTVIICENPNMAFGTAISMFAPPAIEFSPGIHPDAVVADSAKIGDGVHIGACAVIEPNAVIGNNSVIGAGCYIGHETTIGSETLLYPNITVRERCKIGSNVIIHPGTIIGSDGFGYEAGPQGIIKIPQVGIVQIDDHVEIGANCTIDRARFGKTHIKMGVKLDNQVQVAHNVVVGEFSMLIGQCGIAGSAKIGQGVIVAAQAGINGHITLGDGCRIGGTSGVAKDVAPGATLIGTPAEPQRDFMTRLILPKTVNKLKAQLKDLEAKIKKLEG